MVHGHNDLAWKARKEETFARDRYTCKKCGVKKGEYTFTGISLYPRYIKQEGDLFTYHKPRVFNEDQLSFNNQVPINCFVETGRSRKQVNAYPYFFIGLTKDRNADGVLIKKMIEWFIENNPKVFSNVRPWQIPAVKVILDAHHLNGVGNDDRLENLITLCRICHQKTHGAFFKDLDYD